MEVFIYIFVLLFHFYCRVSYLYFQNLPYDIDSERSLYVSTSSLLLMILWRCNPSPTVKGVSFSRISWSWFLFNLSISFNNTHNYFTYRLLAFKYIQRKAVLLFGPVIIQFKSVALREKCPNMELFLVHILLYSDWIRRYTPYLFVFSPNTGKNGPEITQYLDTFHAVIVNEFWMSKPEWTPSFSLPKCLF